MNQDQRAAFEALIVKHGLCITKDKDLYRSHLVGWMLKAYEAALASPEVQALRKDLEQYVGIASELATENEKMRVALEMIAGMRPCPDILMGNADIARAALAAMEKQK